MNEQEALSRMIAPGTPRPSKWKTEEFGLLTVTYYCRLAGNVRVICKCGKKKYVQASNLRNGSIKTCGGSGCKNSLRENYHGMRGTSTYTSWHAMIGRCTDKKDKDYPKYGARGIKVCNRWLDFKKFLEDMGEKPPPDLQIERKDNGGNYEPSNCKWATVKEQANNRRSSRFIEYSGLRLTLKQWAEKIGIGYTTLFGRLDRGIPFAKAISTPTRRYK